MAEIATVNAPASDKPPTLSWKLGYIKKQHFDESGNENWLIYVNVIETYAGGTRERAIERRGVADAKPLVVLLNTRNNAAPNDSEERTIMKWLVTNGYYPASTYSGSPD